MNGVESGHHRDACSPRRSEGGLPGGWAVAFHPGLVGADATQATPNRLAAVPEPAKALERPVFIVASPHTNGASLQVLFAHSTAFWTVGEENRDVLEAIPRLRASAREFSSDRLTEDDADAATAAAVRAEFLGRLPSGCDRGQPAGPRRQVDASPRNTLRIPFLRAVIPDALFVYVFQRPEQALGEMLDTWRSGQYVTYPDLPDWDGPPWSLLLSPGWRELPSRPLAAIVAAQWNRRTATCSMT